MLPGPPLADPVPDESDETVPIGKLDPESEPAEKLLKAANAPTNPPTELLAPAETLPDEVDGSIRPKSMPANPPAASCDPLPVTDEDVEEFWIRPRLMPAKPPSALSDVPVTDPDASDAEIVPP